MINTQKQLQIQQFIQTLGDDELHELYHQLDDQLRIIHRAKELYAMKDFHILDQVSFHHDNHIIQGVIVRINQRTISVQSNDGVRWKVSPRLLKKVKPETKPNDSLLGADPIKRQKSSSKPKARRSKKGKKK